MRFKAIVPALCALLCLTFCLNSDTVTAATAAQSDPGPLTCAQILPLVRKNLSANPGCAALQAGQACYGNNKLTVTFVDGTPAASTPFEAPGNIIQVDSIKSIQTTPLDLDHGEWGVAVMKLRTNLPGTISGAPITFILYGDTRVEDASKPTSTDSAGTPAATPEVSRVTADSVAVPANFNAFYFTTGVSLQPSCKDIASSTLPSGGLLVDSPDGKKVKFTADGVEIVLGSGVIMRAAPNQQMSIIVLHGGVRISAFGKTRIAGTFEQVTIPLGGDNGLTASGPPSFAHFANTSPLVLRSVCQMVNAVALPFACLIAPPTPTPRPTLIPTIRPSATLVPTASLTPTPVCPPGEVWTGTDCAIP